MVDAVPHGQGCVIFVVESAGDLCNGPTGYDFADEDYASLCFSSFNAAYIEAEIDLLEVAMKGDWDATDFRLYKAKAYETKKTMCLP